MKILPVGVQLFHAKGLTDISKRIVVFRNFPNTTKHDVPKSKGCFPFKAQSSLLTNRKIQVTTP